MYSFLVIRMQNQDDRQIIKFGEVLMDSGQLMSLTIFSLFDIFFGVDTNHRFCICRALFGLRTDFFEWIPLVGRSITDELHRKEMATDAAFVEGTNAIPYPRFKQYSYHISTLIDYESEQGQCSTKIVSLHSLFLAILAFFGSSEQR